MLALWRVEIGHPALNQNKKETKKRNKKMSETRTHVIKGCTFYWANFHEPNRYSEKYQVNCTNLSKDDEKALKAIGLTVKDGKEQGKPEMGMYVVAKATRPVVVVDSEKNSIENATNVGNGTIGNVAVAAFDYDHPTGGKGVGCGLQAAQIHELIEYTPAGMFDKEEGGYVAEAKLEEAEVEKPF